MKTIIIIFASMVLLGGTSTSLFSQQDPSFNQYMFNTLSFNPAYAGSKDGLVANALSRFQWVGVAGAPRTVTLTAHTPTFMEQIGVGGSLMYDEIGPEKRYSFNLDFAYRTQLSFKNYVSFGMKLGAFGNQVDFGELKFEDDDPFATKESLSNLSPNIGFGAFLYSEEYYIGASIPRMMKTENPNGTDDPDAKQTPHYYITGGYIFTLSPSLKLKPTTLVKLVSSATPQADASLNFLFHETLWIGAFYRTTNIAGLIVQLQPIKNISFGYSFDYPFSSINNIAGFAGSHELMVGYSFQKKNSDKFKSPRYF